MRLVPAADERTATFEALLDRTERLRPAGLHFDELATLATLYRSHLARLARLRAAGNDQPALRHLNALCVRAHTLLHVEPREAGGMRRALLVELPRALGRTWAALVVAWALLGVGIAVGLMLGLTDVTAVHAILPDGMGYGPDGLDRLLGSPNARREFFERHAVTPGHNAVFGSFLFTHNTRVGLLAFASGILAGIPTVLLQLYNGLLLGAFSAIFVRDQHPWLYLAWILPHGIPELTAICLCVAGGLVLGAAVAVPGRRTRARALRESVHSALLLFGGAVPLFLVAALTESFVRESLLGTVARLGVAGAYAAVLGSGFAWVRRCAARLPPDTAWLASLTRSVRAAADSG